MKGSNLSESERRLFGMHPASMEIADPEKYKSMKWHLEMKKEAKEAKSARKRENKKEQ
jgi:hypothetical protein